MNAAEHVTKLWLQSQGFFVLGALGAGHNEIDILAVRMSKDKSGIADKVQVEVSVSAQPAGGTESLAESLVPVSFTKDN
jgi:hypothetical protein